MSDSDIKKIVRKKYGEIAKGSGSCCGESSGSCCGSSPSDSKRVGYTDGDLASVPIGANMGLGCGNPLALTSIIEGETILDLGAGGGFDCFLAANRVGKSGKVIGVDMTTEMIDKARQNALRGGYKNVEFRLGEIEKLPVADCSVDVIISNCVINLSSNKEKVFQEAFRVLKPNGRIIISDIVTEDELPNFIKESVSAYVGCVSGAINKDSYLDLIRKAGFNQVKIVGESVFPLDDLIKNPEMQRIIDENNITQSMINSIKKGVLSIKVMGIK